MAKVRDYDKEENQYVPLQKLRQRAKRHEVKIAKATEAMVDELSQREQKLSHELLVLRKLLRAVYRTLSDDQKKEYDRLKDEILSAAEIDSDGV